MGGSTATSANEVFPASQRYATESSQLYSSGNMLGFDLDGDDNVVCIYENVNDVFMLTVNEDRATSIAVK